MAGPVSQTIRRARLPGFGLAALLALAACDPVSRSIDYDRKADFSSYSRYVWVAPEAGRTAAGDPPLNPLIEQRVQDAIESVLAAKGFVEGVPPDFTVAYTVGEQTRSYVHYMPDHTTVFDPVHGVRHVRGPSRPIQRTFQESTIAVDVFDVATGRAVWHGSASKEVNPEDTTPEAIGALVGSLLADFPPPAAARTSPGAATKP